MANDAECDVREGERVEEIEDEVEEDDDLEVGAGAGAEINKGDNMEYGSSYEHILCALRPF